MIVFIYVVKQNICIIFFLVKVTLELETTCLINYYKTLFLFFSLSSNNYLRWINPKTIHQTKDVCSYLPGAPGSRNANGGYAS